MRLAIKMSEIKPDKIYLSSCFANAKPTCPYIETKEIAKILEYNTGIPVLLGTHDYH